MHPITSKLLAWYERYHRALPWRALADPYPIWLSEVILQQTRVAQGLPYWERFLAAYPTVHALAVAEDDAVFRLWQGLGYYSRARNLLATARHVAAEGWPTTAEGLAKLPGIGLYTAAAIASFAFGQAVPVLDGNVARVLSRLYDDAGDILKPATQSRMRALAAELMEGAPPATFNQAMMEFGALQCTPGLPLCLVCPLQENCQALAAGTVTQRPVKAAPKAKRERYLAYLRVENQGHLLIRQRTSKDIWQGLYEYILLEGVGEIPTPQALAHHAEEATGLTDIKVGKSLLAKDHVLSHQLLHITVYAGQAKGKPGAVLPPFRWVSEQKWEALGKPVVLVGV